MNKKYIFIIFLAAAIFTVLYFVLVINKSHNQESVFKSNEISFIENFSLYDEFRENKENIFGADCGNDEFNNLKSLAKEGSVKQLFLPGGFQLVLTPNYYNWSNDKFLGFNNPDSGAFCGAGGIFPLYAYKDNLLWSGSCSSGFMPSPDEAGYEDFMNCLESEEMVIEYFENK